MADLVTKGNIFKDGQIFTVFARRSARAKLRSLPQTRLLGDYQLNLNNLTLDLSLQDVSKGDKPKIQGSKQWRTKRIITQLVR